MDRADFRAWSRRAADWSADYLETIEQRPVRAQVSPGEVAAQLAASPPEAAEPMERIFADFERIVPEGITHWQHPRFFAYFPSNTAPAVAVAEQLAATMGVVCMLWQTSPAASEIEVRVMDWLRQAVGLPEGFSGTFQETASMATLCAVLTMRERALEWSGNTRGLAGQPAVRIYATEHTHSSIDKAVWAAGIGQNNLVRIPCDERYAMVPEALRAAIHADREAGYRPAGVVACVGGTSIGACDPVGALCDVAHAEGLFVHTDAAWAGTAMICPEFRDLWKGVERTDSLVMNPSKWLGGSMDCSAHFFRDPEQLRRTLKIDAAYLRGRESEDIVNLSDWTFQLGRRFRALKVWFLLRAYGLEGLRRRMRDHVRWSQALCRRLAAEPDFEIATGPVLSLFSFRYRPTGPELEGEILDGLNQKLLDAINDEGRIFLTPTRHQGRLVIRFVSGQFDTRESDHEIAFEAIVETARSLDRSRAA